MGNRKSMPNAKTEYLDRISCFSYLMQTQGRSENVLQFSIHATIYVLNIMFSDIIYINLTFLLLFFRVVIQSNNNILTKHHIVVTLQLATRGQKLAANVGMDGDERLRTPVLVPVIHHRSTHHAASSLRIANNQELRTWAFCKNVLSFVPTSSRCSDCVQLCGSRLEIWRQDVMTLVQGSTTRGSRVACGSLAPI